MSYASVPSLAPILLLGLLAGFQPVSAWEAVSRCGPFRNCSRGIKCCDNGCCLGKNLGDSRSDPIRIFVIIFLVIIPLLCICGLVKHFCSKCRKPEQDSVMEHQRPADPAFNPPERVWTTSSDLPPSYSEVILKSTPTEPPPPYSLRPEDYTGEPRGIDNPAF